jgi:hypothetical protein
MMTLMPVAAFAADATGINAGESSVFTKDTNVSKKIGNTVNIQFDFEAVGSGSVTTGDVYVWFVKDGADVATLNATATTTGVTVDENGVFKTYKFWISTGGGHEREKDAFIGENPDRPAWRKTDRKYPRREIN